MNIKGVLATSNLFSSLINNYIGAMMKKCSLKSQKFINHNVYQFINHGVGTDCSKISLDYITEFWVCPSICLITEDNISSTGSSLKSSLFYFFSFFSELFAEKKKYFTWNCSLIRVAFTFIIYGFYDSIFVNKTIL